MKSHKSNLNQKIPKKFPKFRNHQIRYDRILVAFVIPILLLIALITGISSCFRKKQNPEESDMPEQGNLNSSSYSGYSDISENSAQKQTYMNVSLETAKIHSGNLLLVNEAHPCEFDHQAIADGTSPDLNFVTIKSILDAKNTSLKPYTASDWEVGLDRTAAQAMDAWFTAFSTSTNHHDLRMIGGYKPDATDSDFQTGRTITVGIFPETGSSYAYKPEGEYTWLSEHAAEYGFILRYPEEKSEFFDKTITERRTATFRYVGVPAALYMREHNLCLEEFLQEIKNYTLENKLVIAGGTKVYYMYYVPADMGSEVTTFRVPDNRDYYEVSGNNMDGFVIAIHGK
ncbi:MAG: D-alanyl-D-alanine carboxypeptidase family protein [Oscillospiraceae bacterium]|nr:D-alanyl-D-alanine carboxypeptidase family protein [Oscillospiraceae bacterium]